MPEAAVVASPHKTTGTVAVALVADRPNHKDNLYGTEIVWLRKGDVKMVPESLWPRFAGHPDVYALAEAGPKTWPAAGASSISRAPAPAESGSEAASAAQDLAIAAAQADLRKVIAKSGFTGKETDEQVRALASDAGIAPLSEKLAGATLRSKVVELAKV